jgi:ankyrin repeat protein
LEKSLDKFVDEIQAGRRDGSVVSVATLDSASANNEQNWLEIWRELEDIGISAEMIATQHDFIISWFLKATADGKLQEDRPKRALQDVAPKQLLPLIPENDPIPLSKVSTVKDRPQENRAGKVLPRNTPREAATETSGRGTPDLPAEAAEATESTESTASPGSESGRMDGESPPKSRPRSKFFKLLANKFGSQRELCDATREGDYARVDKMLKLGVQIDKEDGDTKVSPLMIAVRADDELMVRRLGLGRKTSTFNSSLSIALDYAITHEKWMVLKPLFDLGAQAQSRHFDLLVGGGNKAMAELIFQKGGAVVRTHGKSILSSAARDGKMAVVQQMLELGADVNGFHDRCTALHVAVLHGHMEIIQLLLKKGADIQLQISSRAYRSWADGSSGYTPLHCASLAGSLAIVELLLACGAGAETEDAYGRRPLMIALMKGHEDVVRLLMENGADCSALDRFRSTALFWACSSESESIIEMLLEKGADVRGKNRFGWTALHQAALIGKRQIVDLLLEKRPNVNAKDRDGWTALHFAVYRRDSRLILLLLKNGADVNMKADALLKTEEGEKTLEHRTFGHVNADSILTEWYLKAYHWDEGGAIPDSDSDSDSDSHSHSRSGRSFLMPDGSEEWSVTARDIAKVLGFKDIKELLTDFSHSHGSEQARFQGSGAVQH